VFSVEITLSGFHSGNSFEISHRLTGFLNYVLFSLSFCLSLNLKPVNYFTTRRSSIAKRESGSVRPNSLFAMILVRPGSVRPDNYNCVGY
jgi:hypothetical protein